MKTGTRIAVGLFLFLVVSHGFDGGWAAASLAAETPLMPLECTFSDRVADQVLSKVAPLEREAPLAVLAQEQIPSANAGDDEQRGRAIEMVSPLPKSGSTADAAEGALIPAAPLGSAYSHPVVQSPIPPSIHGPASHDSQR